MSRKLTQAEKDDAFKQYQLNQQKQYRIGRFLTLFIGIINIVLAFVSQIAEVNLFSLAIQIVLSILLLAGFSWVRYLMGIVQSVAAFLYFFMLADLWISSVSGETVTQKWWAILIMVILFAYSIVSAVILFTNKAMNEYMYDKNTKSNTVESQDQTDVAPVESIFKDSQEYREKSVDTSSKFDKKKIIKTAVITAVVLVMVAGIFFGVILFSEEYVATEIAQFSSPDGNYTLIFEQIGSPGFPFGSVDVKFTVEDKNGVTVAKMKNALNNDGGSAKKENIKEIKWENDRITILLDESDLEFDRELVIEYN